MDQAETKRKFQLYTVSEIRNLPRRKYLVKGILDQGTLSVVYGESNSGKSLLVINICCNIVMGSPWIGNKSRAGTAIYVAAEGGYGIADRLEAARLAGQIDDTAPFFILPTTVNLSKDDTDVNEFIKEIDRLESRPGIIVIDTLARAMAGGDENSGKDMGILIANCDIIRQHTGAHVLIVHHTGKNIALGARGHSSLKAAIETEIFVSQDRDKIITAEISKQRDGATGGKYSFELKVFNIREDEDGENVTSCALTPAHGIIETIKLSKTARLARDTLQALMLSTGDEAMEALGHRAVKIQTFHEKLMTSDISSADNLDSRKKAIVRAINTLKEQGIISLCETYVWFTDNLDKSGQNQKDILP